MLLTESQKNQFEDEGLILINPEFPDTVLAGAVSIWLDHKDYRPGFDLYDSQAFISISGRRIQDAWKLNVPIRKIATWPRILAILEELYKHKPCPFQTLNYPLGTEQPICSDTIHFNSTAKDQMCGVLVALEDVDENNGPLVYYPGSHKLQEYNMQDAGLRPTPDHYPQYEAWLLEQVLKTDLQPRHALMKRGQAVIWAANLLHGDFERIDLMRTRHSQATHYFFDVPGCLYYTPLLSSPGRLHFRHPDWIT